MPKKRTEIKVDQYQKRIWTERSNILKLNISEYLRFLDNNFGHIAIECFNGADCIVISKETAEKISSALNNINKSDSEIKFKTKIELIQYIINKHLNEEIKILTEGVILHPKFKRELRRNKFIK